MKKIFTTTVMLLMALAVQATIRYVKQTAAGTANGSSWANASADIQAMVNASTANDQVWVAGGTYKPNRRADAVHTITASDRNNAFVLKVDVKIYGSFAGTETLLTQRTKAVMAANASTLSGDFGGNDAGFANNAENAYHVVVSANFVGTATLDGFTVKNGNANDGGSITVNAIAVQMQSGGGMYVINSSPILANISFTTNNAVSNGGGLCNLSSSTTCTNCVFSGNTGDYGAGIYNYSSPAVFTNIVVSGNKAAHGGGVRNNVSAAVFTNATFSGNIAGVINGPNNGSSIYNTGSNIKLRNSIIYGNRDGILNDQLSKPIIEYSLVQGLPSSAPGNIDGNGYPVFIGGSVDYFAAPTVAGNLRIAECSPINNKGSNTYYAAGQTPDLTAVITDLDGNSRFYNGGAVDLGAYEVQGTFEKSPLPASSISFTKTVTTTTIFGDCFSLVATLAPLGTTGAVGGSVTAKVYVQAGAPTYNGAPYVRRTYDIRPVDNADAATATITLYFLQSDFTDYNTKRGTFPSLPIDGSDAAGNRANLRIYQQHGTSTTGNLGSYTGWGGTGTATVDITPTSVNYNTTSARWEATFPVTGFSGFFAHSGTSAVLPIKLLSFTANNAGSRNRIDWSTATEDPGTSFEIARGSNGSSFDKIGAAAGKGHDAAYTFYDDQPLNGTNYYRLKIMEADGATTFSNIAVVRNDGARGSISVSPIPAPNTVTISNTNTALIGTLAIIYDMQGRAVHSFTLSVNNQVNVAAWAAGIYNLRLVDGTTVRLVKQ